MMDFENRWSFLSLAALFEAGLLLLALAVGRLVDVHPLAELTLRWEDALWGCLAAGGLVLLLFVGDRLPLEELRRIKRLLVELLGRPLAECRWYELVLLAAWVGFSEEALFRGLVQPWMERHLHPVAALLCSNVVFGLLHCVTFVYGVLAGLTGVYLGWLLDAGAARNLLIPVVAHAVYDFVAFVWIARSFRQQQGRLHRAAEGVEVGAGIPS